MTTIKALFLDTLKIATDNLNRGDYERTKNNLITALNIMTAISEDLDEIKKLKNVLFNMKGNLPLDQQAKLIQDTYLKILIIGKEIGLIDVSKKDIF